MRPSSTPVPGRSSRLPAVVLAMTVTGLVASLLLAGLVVLGILTVPWDAMVLPWIALAGVPFNGIGSLLACASYLLHRDGRSLLAVVIGLFATAAALGALVLVVGTAMANHPI